MTTNKEILEHLMNEMKEIRKDVGEILDKITFMVADEDVDTAPDATPWPTYGKPIEGGREEPEPEKKTKTIVMLTPGMENVQFAGDVEDISKIYEGTDKSGREYKYQRFTIMDNTGNIIITLWGDQIDKFAYVRKDDHVIVDAWQISMYKTQKQAKLGKYGKITIMNEAKEKHIL